MNIYEFEHIEYNSAARLTRQGRPPLRAGSEAGFTLLEVMVSLAILGFGILTVIQLFSGGLGLALAATDHAGAVSLAREKMATTLINNNILPGITEGGAEEKGEKGLRWQVEVTPVLNANTDDNVNLYIMKVVVSVRKAGSSEASYRLTSMKTVFLEE